MIVSLSQMTRVSSNSASRKLGRALKTGRMVFNSVLFPVIQLLGSLEASSFLLSMLAGVAGFQ